MNAYKSTVNLPGHPAFKTRDYPDSAQTAVLVGLGILIPAKRSLLEPVADEPAPPRVSVPGGLSGSPAGAERP